MKSNWSLRHVFAASALVFCLCSNVSAQESRATLSGTITDPSGSSVAGAKLSLTNIETGTPSTAESNQAGQYRFLFLNPGKYRMTAELTGFRTYVREGIELN